MKPILQITLVAILGFFLVSAISQAQFAIRTSSNAATGETRAIQDHDLIRGEDGIKVYIVRGDYKRHILNPEVFALYGHLRWEDILEVADEAANSYTISNLYRAVGDERVYIAGGSGAKRWIEDPETFGILQFSPDQIFDINQSERDLYAEQATIDQATAEVLVASSTAQIGEIADPEELARKLTEKIQELAIQEVESTLPSPEASEGEATATTTDPGTATSTDSGTATSTDPGTATTTEPTSTPAPSNDGGGGGSATEADNTPPAAITDLTILYPSAATVFLTWTATGDDGTSGTTTSFDIRYSTTAITESNWSSATQATDEPTPGESGSAHSMGIGGLTNDTTYYFAIKAIDENNNESALSNVPSQQTSDITAPANVTDLAAASPTYNSVVLSWTAPGDSGSIGTASTYEFRRHSSTITDANWSSATYIPGASTPQIAGTSESFTATSLSDNTSLYFAMKTKDESGNWSSLSNVASATTLCNPLPTGSVTYSVSGGSGDPKITSLTLDPLDAAVSSSQIITVAANDTNSNSITSVAYSIATDTSTAIGTLPLVSGTDTSGTWEDSYTETEQQTKLSPR